MTASSKFKIIVRGFAARCRDFKESPDAQPREASVIIVPIKLIRIGGDVMITWSCSRGGSCFAACGYAWGWKNVKRPMEARA